MLVSSLILCASAVLASSVPERRDLAASDCKTTYLSVPFTAQNVQFRNVSKPKSQLDVATIGILQNRATSNYTKAITGGDKTVKETVKIFTTYCIPKSWNGELVEILVHGIGVNSGYWKDPSDPSSSYINAALAAGHAVVAYDRLGTGLSDAPDGLNIVQTPADIQVLRYIIEYVKQENTLKKAKTFVGVGHSFGSIQLTGIAKQYPALLNKLILTGYSTSSLYLPLFNFAFASTITSMVNPVKFARYAKDLSYWASASPGSDLEAFFNPGYYTTAAFNYFATIKSPFTQGEDLTLSGPTQALPAEGFTGEIIVVTGDRDLPFCGGNCYQAPQKTQGTTLLDDVRVAFPKASKFSIYVPPNTGHAVNGHITAPQTYSVINRWLNGTYQ